MSRTILHSDMNCFYASVEMLHHPELAGKPMAVGGDPEARHGIVLTANYIAKRAGVKTGMALWQARQVCPEIIFVPPRMDLYLRFSRMAQEIYSEYTDQREPFGIDESWLDVTASTSIKGDGMKIAKEISSRIKYELGVTVSIGVSWNKIFAKLGSDYKKPDAITEFSKDNYKDIAWKLPVGDLLMVGRSTERTMKKLGICTIGDLAGAEPSILETSEYYPEVLQVEEDCIKETGTKIVLRKLKKLTTSLTPEYIKKRVARRFGIIGKEFSFSVYVNGEEVSISDRDYFHKLSYIWYFGNESQKYADFCENVSHKEERENIISCNGENYKITGWIGSVDASGDLKDGEDNLNKIVVLVRGKLGQEDILSEYSEGGLYSKYLIGEINADFFDDDTLDDMATSNRQEYRKDDERFIALKQFVQDELKYIQGKWTELRNESGEEKARELLPVIDTWCKSLQGDDKKYAKKMFGKINQIVADDDKKKEILKFSVLAFEKLKYAKHLSAIDNIEAENFEVFKDIFTGLDEIEATLYYQIIRERIEVIKVFQSITDENALEKVIQTHLFNHLWLLDPSWERVENTQYMETTVLNALNSEYNSLTSEEKAGRLDVGYRQTAGKHIIIELKRADRIVTTSEMIKQVKKYHDALNKVLSAIYQTNYSFEILFVLGRPIDNNDSIENRELVANILKPMNARVVYYQELIENAYKAYNEYIAANKQSQPLIDMFSQLESSMDD